MAIKFIRKPADKKFDTNGVSKIFGVPPTTIAGWRKPNNVGPEYIKPSDKDADMNERKGVILYRQSALKDFTKGVWPEEGRFIDTKEAAETLGIVAAALRKMRQRGKGPKPVYLCGVVRYRPEDCGNGNGEVTNAK